jgi:hypothetical protein
MTPSTMRLIAILFMLAAVILMVLSLKRVADLGTFWVGLPLFVIGLAFLARSKKAVP